MSTFQLDDRGVIVNCAKCGQKNRLLYDHVGDGAQCGRCKEALAPPAAPIEAPSVEDFDRLVSAASVPVVVDYWAPWCGPCRMVAPELEKVASRQAGRLLVVKVNTDVLTELGSRYAIRLIPTLAVFSGGREVGRTTGARPARDIEAFVEQVASKQA